mmetsp:Transcript_6195/g.20222  ORF Transcript_6195/g.20222 Transcript_6195/m.20222 type:complete len:277 (+) Transcript_6195:267-1097(+)
MTSAMARRVVRCDGRWRDCDRDRDRERWPSRPSGPSTSSLSLVLPRPSRGVRCSTASSLQCRSIADSDAKRCASRCVRAESGRSLSGPKRAAADSRADVRASAWWPRGVLEADRPPLRPGVVGKANSSSGRGESKASPRRARTLDERERSSDCSIDAIEPERLRRALGAPLGGLRPRASVVAPVTSAPLPTRMVPARSAAPGARPRKRRPAIVAAGGERPRGGGGDREGSAKSEVAEAGSRCGCWCWWWWRRGDSRGWSRSVSWRDRSRDRSRERD